MLIIKHSRDGQKKVEFYHNQWGYGRCMYLAVMYLYMRYYNTDSWGFEDKDDCGTLDERRQHRETNFIFRHGTLEGMGNFSDELSFCKEGKERMAQQDFYNTADIGDLDSVLNVCETGDNNNGWCVVDIAPGDDEFDKPHFKVGWILGDEETLDYDKYDNCRRNKWYHKWATAEEYGRLNGGSDYSDKQFVKMFREFCDYFGIEDIAAEIAKEKKAEPALETA